MSDITFPVPTRLDQMARAMLVATLKANGNDKVAAARTLGISSRTIYNWLEEMEGKPVGDPAHPFRRKPRPTRIMVGEPR